MVDERIKGRIASVFDGSITDKQTGEVKTYSPSVTVYTDKGDTVKVALFPEDFKSLAPVLGANIELVGVLKKPAQPAQYQCMQLHAKK